MEGLPGSAYHRSCREKNETAAKDDYKRLELAQAMKDSAREESEALLRLNLLKGKWFLKGADALIRQNPVYYDQTAAWWIWNQATRCWEQRDETDILNLCRETLTLIGDTSVRHSNNLLKALQQVSRERQPADLPPAWVQFGATQVNVFTGEQRTSEPTWFSTNSIPWNIGQTTNTPVMDSLIESWVGKEHIQTIYEIIAYCTYRDYPIHRVFCFVGSGANGKTRLLKIIEKFIGQENKSSVTLQKMSGNHFALYPLYRKLACFVGETAHHKLDSTEIIKALSGQDPVSFEAKGRDSFTGVNYAKLFIGTNTLPQSADSSRGWYRRWFIIKFPNEFQEGEDVLNRIPDAEYEALAAKCVHILPELLKNGRFTGEGSIDERRESYIQNSNPIKTYIEETYDRDPDASIRYTEVYIDYLNYLASHKLRRIGRKEFSQSLEDEGVESERKSFRDPITGDVTTYFVIFGLKKKPVQRLILSSETSTTSNTGNTCNTDPLTDSKTLYREIGTDKDPGITGITSITSRRHGDDDFGQWSDFLDEQPGGTAIIDDFLTFLTAHHPGVSYDNLKANGEIYEPRAGFVRRVL